MVHNIYNNSSSYLYHDSHDYWLVSIPWKIGIMHEGGNLAGSELSSNGIVSMGELFVVVVVLVGGVNNFIFYFLCGEKSDDTCLLFIAYLIQSF